MKWIQHPDICFGVTIEHLSILSTDPSFTPVFVSEPHQIIYKLLSLKNFSVYANPDEKPITFSSAEQLASILKQVDILYNIRHGLN
jgi:hypothetical protein